MKTKTIIRALSAMAALLLITACSDIDNTIIEQPDGKEYTTVPFSATVSNASETRAGLNGSKQYVFETGDKLYVEGTGVYGYLTLKAEDAGKRTGATFEGNLNVSGMPASTLALNAVLVSSTDALHTISGDKVTATTYPTNAIAATEAEAIEKYSDFTGSATYGTPSFTLNQQSAFISFDVTLVDNTATSTAVDVSISNDGGVVRTGSTTTTTVGTDIKAQFVAAFPGGSTTLSNASVTLGTRPAISFGGSTALAVNKIYQVTKGYVDLSTLTANYEAKNGDMLTGELGGNYKISITDNDPNTAIVTLNGVTINRPGVADDGNFGWAGITCEGDATIILADGTTNTVKGFYRSCPGIHIPKTKTLTIQGGGALNASSNGKGAGIGSHWRSSCGNIIIKDGNITATGGDYAAGIGCVYDYAECGHITISGGMITARGGYNATGIGGSYYSPCGNIEISGGIVTAIGNGSSAAIGSGQNGSCGTITITENAISVTAISSDGGGYIGPGYNGTCGTVTIDGVANATTASSFPHFTSTISTTTNTNDTWTLTNGSAPALSRTLSAVTTNEVGWRIGSDGKAYSPVGALPAGVTAVAMIAYVGAAGSADASSATYKGLAIALADESDSYCNYGVQESAGVSGSTAMTDHKTILTGIADTQTLTTKYVDRAANKAANYSVAGFNPTTYGCSNWFLPSSGQWLKFFKAAGVNVDGLSNWSEWTPGGSDDWNKINTLLTTAAGSSFNEYEYYWSSTEYDYHDAVIVCFSPSSGMFVTNYNKNYGTGNAYVRAFFAF